MIICLVIAKGIRISLCVCVWVGRDRDTTAEKPIVCFFDF